MLLNIFILASVSTLSSASAYPCESFSNGSQCDFVVKCNEFVEPHFEPTCHGYPNITIILSNAYEDNFQQSFFGKLKFKFTNHVQEIKVINSTLSFVYTGAFDYFHNCLRIDLSQNNIRAVTVSFGSLYKLNFLNLSCNHLESIKEKLFNDGYYNENMLQELDLSNNKIIDVGRNLNQLVNLRKLYLQNNRLMSIDGLEFWGLVHLTHLFMQHNLLITVPPFLALIHKLETLDLSSNNLTLIDFTDFFRCNELEILLIDNNSIDTLLIDENVQNLKKFKKLSLKGNPLVCKEIEPEFENSTDIEKHIEVITDEIFYVDKIDRIKCESSSFAISTTTKTPQLIEAIPATSRLTTLDQDELTLPDSPSREFNITIEDLQETILELNKIKTAQAGFESEMEKLKLKMATIMSRIETKKSNTTTTDLTESTSMKSKSEESPKFDSEKKLDNVILEQEKMRSELEAIKRGISDHNIVMLQHDKPGSSDDIDDNIVITKLPESDEKEGVNLVLSLATKLGIQLKHVGTVSDKQKP